MSTFCNIVANVLQNFEIANKMKDRKKKKSIKWNICSQTHSNWIKLKVEIANPIECIKLKQYSFLFKKKIK